MAEVNVVSISATDITGVILAGGLGRRMGGVDKGLQDFLGQSLVQHALERLHAQVATVGINANRHLDQYHALGAPVWPDADTEFSGPLSGFLAGLQHCVTPYLLTVPCDTPRFPLDLATRLAQALREADADIAMAAAPERNAQGHTQIRAQPVFCLLKASLIDSLRTFMRDGGRKIDAWTAQHHTVEVPFDAPGDDPLSFYNINTLQELQSFAASHT